MSSFKNSVTKHDILDERFQLLFHTFVKKRCHRQKFL